LLACVDPGDHVCDFFWGRDVVGIEVGEMPVAFPVAEVEGFTGPGVRAKEIDDSE
jgi:hypothetical protein